MPVYNAALPILEAYMKGAQLKLEQEKQKEHSQILKEQLAEQVKHNRAVEQMTAEKGKLESSVVKLENLLRMQKALPGMNLPSYQQPTGVTPTGMKTEMPSAAAAAEEIPVEAAPADVGIMGPSTPAQTFENMPANIRPQAIAAQPGQEAVIPAPNIQQTAPVAAAPEMQSITKVKPGTEVAGIDVSQFKTPEEALNQEISKVFAVAKATSSGTAEGQKGVRAEARAEREEDKKLLRTHQEIMQENMLNSQALNQQLNRDQAKILADERNKIQKDYNAARTEHEKTRIAQGWERINLSRQKLQAAKQSDKHLQNLLPDMSSGLITQESLRLEDAKTRGKMLDLARENDVVLLTNKQSDALKDMLTVKKFYQASKTLADKIEKLSPQDRINPDIVAAINQERADILGFLEPVAKSIGYKGAITKDEQTRLEAYVPRLYRWGAGENNKTGIKFLKDFVNSKVDTILPPEHFKSGARQVQHYNLKKTFNAGIDQED